ncbi:MAG: hypothetical protein WC595_00240 [Candidatus Nanoarchaeia archaeon]
MRFNYVLGEELEKRLDETGLTKRISAYLKQYENPTPVDRGYIMDTDVPGFVEDMIERGHFAGKDLEGFRRDLRSNLIRMAEDGERHPWIVQKRNGEEKENGECEDALVLSGFYGSFVVTPEEMKADRPYGFSSALEAMQCISAMAVSLNHLNMIRGKRWRSKTENGQAYESVVSGDMNLDLRIYREDITAYPAINPLGETSLFRAEMDSDRQILGAYHSTEPTLLAAILSYAEQTGAHSKILTKEGYRKFLADAVEQGQRIGAATECFNGVDEHRILMTFIGSDLPLPRINQAGEVDRGRSNYFIPRMGEGGYEVVIGPEGSLVFVGGEQSKKVVGLSIPPAEIDLLVESLFTQASMGLGRTQASMLAAMVEYKFSGRLETDLRNLNERIGRE